MSWLPLPLCCVITPTHDVGVSTPTAFNGGLWPGALRSRYGHGASGLARTFTIQVTLLHTSTLFYGLQQWPLSCTCTLSHSYFQHSSSFFWLLSTHRHSFTSWCSADVITFPIHILPFTPCPKFTYHFSSLSTVLPVFCGLVVCPRLAVLMGTLVNLASVADGFLGLVLCLNPGGDFADPDQCCILAYKLLPTNALLVSIIEIQISIVSFLYIPVRILTDVSWFQCSQTASDS